jgi:hypothetical protein
VAGAPAAAGSRFLRRQTLFNGLRRRRDRQSAQRRATQISRHPDGDALGGFGDFIRRNDLIKAEWELNGPRITGPIKSLKILTSNFELMRGRVPSAGYCLAWRVTMGT